MGEHQGWIGVDLDGTLAHYDEWRGPDHIGEPIVPMLNRVKVWIAEGREVRIFTARVSGTPAERLAAIGPIARWCLEHLGCTLDVTHEKDYGMVELWDDRAVQVEKNTGRRVDGQ